MLSTVLAASILGATSVKTDHYIVHKFMVPIGDESATVRTIGGKTVTDVRFQFTDRGSPVRLTAKLVAGKDSSPKSMVIKGSVARMVPIDLSVDVTGRQAKVTVAGKVRTEPVSGKPALVSGYAPATFQGRLIRTWIAAGKPATLRTVPAGTVEIRHSKTDSFDLNGRKVKLERYTVKGLIWGIETVWTDAGGGLAAVICRDAEFDHFEAVADRFEPLLSRFAALAGQDATEELARVSKGALGPPAPLTALVGGRLFDGTGSAVLEDSVIVLKGGRIAQIGPRASTPVPSGAKVVDARGKTVLPGLWDMHAHYEQAEWGPVYLAAGVTTIRDCGNVLEFITAVRDSVASGKGIGPRLLLAGILDGDGPYALGRQRVNSVADAKAVVGLYKSKGFDQIKIYSSLKPELVKAVCDEAHNVGMTVTGHLPDGVGLLDGIAAGMDMVNHVGYLSQYAGRDRDLDAPKFLEAVEAMRSHGTVFDPTLAVFESMMHDKTVPALSLEPGLAFVAPALKPTLMSGRQGGEASDARNFESLCKVVGRAYKAGVKVVAGTDQTVPGHSLHRELELYVKGGLTPTEALLTATRIPAEVMGRLKDSGTVEVGKRADLVIVDGNPVQSIHDIRNVRTVVAAGRVYDPARLWRLAGFAPPRFRRSEG
ncbi:MAG: amidohydrolase family protein [Armatimonadetes bacterium]|nr:amidohydrolase family protein [Armatimonadota bacterium]